MNEHKSEAITGLLKSNNYRLTKNKENADIIIFNTCIVRQKPEHKVHSEIGIVEKMKELRPNLLLGIGGCMAQVRGDGLFDQSEAVDFIFGTSQIKELPRLIKEAQNRKNGKLKAIETPPKSLDNLPLCRVNSFRANVTITEGCNNYCSFCIVPRARGPLRSSPITEIMEEIKKLVQEGYQEVILLGQNVNAYGDDLQNATFAELLSKISRIDIPRVRFTSPHPKDFTPDIIEVISKSKNICNHLHLPVQAGSNRVLTDMNRGYTKEHFLQLVADIKAKIPNINITTDIIVGYPGETERDFKETMDLMKRVKFGGSYIFKYCPRQHTRSFYKEDDVPQAEKQRRLEKLLNLQREINKEENEKMKDEIVEVLIEGRSRNGDGKLYGKSRAMKTVTIKGEEKLIGEIIKAKVIKTSPGALYGKVVNG